MAKAWNWKLLPGIGSLLVSARLLSPVLNVVSTLSNKITVLTRGRILAEGDYAAVSANPEVREAYLGVGHA